MAGSPGFTYDHLWEQEYPQWPGWKGNWKGWMNLWNEAMGIRGKRT